jgi:twitching motility protein PilT
MPNENNDADDLLQPLTLTVEANAAPAPEQSAQPDFYSAQIAEATGALDDLLKARQEADEKDAAIQHVFSAMGNAQAPPKLALLQMEREADDNQPKHQLGIGISKALPVAGSASDDESPAPQQLRGEGIASLADASSNPDVPVLIKSWERPEQKSRPKNDNELNDLSSTDSADQEASSAPAVELSDGLLCLQNLHIDELLRMGVDAKASDLHITVGLPPMVRVDGAVVPLPCEVVTPRQAQRLIFDVLNEERIEKFERTKELDFSYGVENLGRFRFNVYRQRGSVAAAMRTIPGKIPSLDSLRLPPILRQLTHKHSGLILVTGPTGSGKSTTIASMIDVINSEHESHIMTIEDPIEYLHMHKRCMINQRELGADTDSFANALKAVLREDPDVILVGEMRDLETISAAITLAETGHLVFGTLHTRSAPATIDRIIDVFPSHQQGQIRTQLSTSLEAVVAQQLMPKIGGGRVAAIEIMVATSALRNLIRDGKTYQIYSVIETGQQYGMQAMDRVLADLVKAGVVTNAEAAPRSVDPQNFERLLKML